MPSELNQRVNKLIQETKLILEALLNFPEAHDRRIKEALRRSLADDVDFIVKIIMWLAEEKRRICSTEKEVLVVAGPNHKFFTRENNKKNLLSLATSTKEKLGYFMLPIDAFNKIFNELKSAILEGRKDELLNNGAEEALYHAVTEAFSHVWTTEKAPFP